MTVRYVAELAHPVVSVSTLLNLQQLDTISYGEGTLCYVSQTQSYYSFQPIYGPAADGISVFAASRYGVWVLMLQGSAINGGITGGGGGGGVAAPTRLSGPATLTTAQTNVFANTSGGGFTLTMPASPTDGLQISFTDSNNSFDANNLTVAANSGQQIRDVALVAGNYAATTKLTVKGATYTFAYDLTNTRWNLQ